MNATNDLERRVADFYATEAPVRAPDWVLASALATIDTTQQRRVLIRVPWRFQNMNTYAKLAVAAVAVVAVGAIGLAIFRPGTAPSVGAGPSPTPAPSTSPDPSAPPPLSETFTSTIHGISISYPEGWTATPATEPWTSIDQVNFGPALDHVNDPILQDHLFVSLASQPLNGTAGETWATELLDTPDLGCGVARESITVDGASGLLCPGAMAAVWAGDRGYFIWLYLSGDDPWLPRYYDKTWFRGVLDTVRLHPEDAIDVAPSASPSSSP